MLLKQRKNPCGRFVWRAGEKVCACMIGQIAMALNPKLKNIVNLNIAASMIDIEFNSMLNRFGVITAFSDGEVKKVDMKQYRKECTILRKMYPKLKLRFPRKYYEIKTM